MLHEDAEQMITEEVQEKGEMITEEVEEKEEKKPVRKPRKKPQPVQKTDISEYVKKFNQWQAGIMMQMINRDRPTKEIIKSMVVMVFGNGLNVDEFFQSDKFVNASGKPSKIKLSRRAFDYFSQKV